MPKEIIIAKPNFNKMSVVIFGYSIYPSLIPTEIEYTALSTETESIWPLKSGSFKNSLNLISTLYFSLPGWVISA